MVRPQRADRRLVLRCLPWSRGQRRHDVLDRFVSRDLPIDIGLPMGFDRRLEPWPRAIDEAGLVEIRLVGDPARLKPG
jgi:hypothetical protein